MSACIFKKKWNQTILGPLLRWALSECPEFIYFLLFLLSMLLFSYSQLDHSTQVFHHIIPLSFLCNITKRHHSLFKEQSLISYLITNNEMEHFSIRYPAPQTCPPPPPMWLISYHGNKVFSGDQLKTPTPSVHDKSLHVRMTSRCVFSLQWRVQNIYTLWNTELKMCWHCDIWFFYRNGICETKCKDCYCTDWFRGACLTLWMNMFHYHNFLVFAMDAITCT